jgi:hypothetical protein
MFNCFIPKVPVRTGYGDKYISVAKALKGLVRGQWVWLNGTNARILNHCGKTVTLVVYGKNGPEILAFQ